MSALYDIFAESQLDGFSGAGLFGRLGRPYAPTEMTDSRSLKEFLVSDEWVSQTRIEFVRNVEALRSWPSWRLLFRAFQGWFFSWKELSWRNRFRALMGPPREAKELFQNKSHHQKAQPEARHSSHGHR
jgi:hypothetical protein